TELRANQLALLAGMVDERETSPELKDLLAHASEHAEEDSPAAANIRETRWKLEREEKVPAELVEELMRTATLGRKAWMEAREKSDFSIFRPWLERMLAILRRKAAAIGYEQSPYDALLEDYEPGLKTADLERIFPPLRDAIVDLLERILGSGRPVDASLLERDYPVANQETLVRETIQAIGFDMDRGRLDTSVHPMCSGTGPFDVRLMTRYNPRFFNEAFFGALHEAGHGLYEQGLNAEHFGTPMGMYCSLGIHESQSRLWENFVGRSLGFLRRFFPRIKARFPEALQAVGLEDFHRAVNKVEPTFIRVEADEVTYNLHVFLRFELEQALLSGKLEPADLPQAWNETFERYLKIRPETDADGCLQDIHWSAGLFAYFPTYTLGNIYGAQLFECARTRLIEEATGTPPSHEPLVRHLNTKYGAIYGLE
ncbi:MAG: carboxypeptidase M32, partial [Planctomycetota bacterium]